MSKRGSYKCQSSKLSQQNGESIFKNQRFVKEFLKASLLDNVSNILLSKKVLINVKAQNLNKTK